MDENGYVVISSDKEEEVGQVHFQTKVFLLKCLLIISIKVVPDQSGKIEYEREKHPESDD